MVTILIVEDDEMIRLLIRTRLSSFYRFHEANDGVQALAVMEHEHIDLLIVDIQMPCMNGYDFVNEVRESGDMTPVIMLTAMGSFSHKKQGYSLGIDDYLVKPVDCEELRWHIDALLRRARIANEKKIEIGRLVLEQESCLVSYDGRRIELTPKEFELLYRFLSYPDTVFTKQQLMDEIWGYDTETEYDTIKTYVSRLRRKLGDCPEFSIRAIRGLGYKAVLGMEEKMDGGSKPS